MADNRAVSEWLLEYASVLTPHQRDNVAALIEDREERQAIINEAMRKAPHWTTPEAQPAKHVFGKRP